MNYMFFLNLLIYMLMYFISFHLVMNSDDWFLVWLGLEINMIMFLIFIYNQYDMNSSESCLKYFFVQSLGSGIFMSLFYMEVVNIEVAASMMMSYKVGAGPFFFWFPSLCMMISWVSCFILLTIQKFIPLMLMNLFMNNFMMFILVLSLVIGIMGSFSQSNLKQLLAYSSVFHLGWIISCNMVDDMSWMTYMLLYVMMLFPLMYFLLKYNMLNIMDVMKLKNKMLFVFLMLSMSGMPPLLGFFVKWFALMVIFKVSYFIMMMLVMSSVVMFYVYFRLLYDVLLMGFEEGMWLSWMENNYKNTMWMDMVVMFGLFMGSIFLMMEVM